MFGRKNEKAVTHLRFQIKTSELELNWNCIILILEISVQLLGGQIDPDRSVRSVLTRAVEWLLKSTPPEKITYDWKPLGQGHSNLSSIFLGTFTPPVKFQSPGRVRSCHQIRCIEVMQIRIWPLYRISSFWAMVLQMCMWCEAGKFLGGREILRYVPPWTPKAPCSPSRRPQCVECVRGAFDSWWRR